MLMSSSDYRFRVPWTSNLALKCEVLVIRHSVSQDSASTPHQPDEPGVTLDVAIAELRVKIRPPSRGRSAPECGRPLLVPEVRPPGSRCPRAPPAWTVTAGPTHPIAES